MRLVLTILVLFSLSAQGQYTKHIRNSGTGHASGNNRDIAYLQHIPPANPNGNKHAAWIYLHGIDHRGAIGDIVTANGVDRLIGKGIPKLIATAPMPYFRAPGSTPIDSNYAYAVWAPQGYTGDGAWPEAYLTEMIEVAKENHATIDTNKIYLCVYSWGGQAASTYPTKNTYINENLAYVVIIAGGGPHESVNYTNAAASGIAYDIFYTADDPLVPPSVYDNWINAMNAQKPRWPVQARRFTGAGLPGSGTGHDKILTAVMDTIAGDTYAMTNGDTYLNNPTIFHRALLFRKGRAKKP